MAAGPIRHHPRPQPTGGRFSGNTEAAPHDLPRLEEVSVRVPVLLFALGLSALVAAGLGAFTALRVTSGNLQPHLSGRRATRVDPMVALRYE